MVTAVAHICLMLRPLFACLAPRLSCDDVCFIFCFADGFLISGPIVKNICHISSTQQSANFHAGVL